jgi:hypothetical protein
VLFGARTVARKWELVAWRSSTRWAPLERPDEIATAEVDKVKNKSIKRDVPFALLRGTIGQVTTPPSAPPRMRMSSP